MNKKILWSVFPVLLVSHAFAHQPRTAESQFVEVANPEVSQAFYAELRGKPAVYQINSGKPFRLYVGLLLPDLPGVRRDVSAEILRIEAGTMERLAFLDGSSYSWSPFFEPFAGDDYLRGPEFGAPDSSKGSILEGREVPSGTYRVRVFNSDNQGKYALVFGDLERWPVAEVLNAFVLIPEIKQSFFEKSFWPAYFNRFNLILGAAFLVPLIIMVLLVRTIVHIFRRHRVRSRIQEAS